MTENEQRAAVVAEARKWLGTPYHSCAAVLGAGVDCGQLIVKVFVDAGLVAPFETGVYPSDFHLHRGEERYLEFVERHLHRVETPAFGDVMVFKIGRVYSHGGIVTAVDRQWVEIVHAYMNARQVVEDRLWPSHELMKPIRMPRVYSYWKPP